MSKHKESKPRLADWEARVALGVDGLVQTQEFPGTRWERDDRGFYTFRDHEGIVAEFAPGGVLSVRRAGGVPADPGPVAIGRP